MQIVAGGDFGLRKMMTAKQDGEIVKFKSPVKLERSDNVFR